MRDCKVKFYDRKKMELKVDTITVENFEEALRYAKAMKRAHGWLIKDIVMQPESKRKVHTFG